MAKANTTFKGGIHMEDYKALTCDKPVKEPVAPSTVKIALNQHTGVDCKPLVKVGDHVYAGQKIGDSDAGLSVPVHSSVSGEVTAIERLYKADGWMSDAIVIESDGKDELAYEEKELDYENMTKEEIIGVIREAGIVGLGGAAFPTHIKLSPQKPIDTVLVNGSECEPYLTADHKIMELCPEEIVKGIKVVLKVLGAEKAIICIEDNKALPIERMKEAAAKEANIEVESMETKYPQGDERMLTKTILDREIQAGALPLDFGVVVINVYSCKAIHDAIYKNKPLYERIVTVTGSAVKEAQNLYVKNGVSLGYLFENCGGLTEDAEKIVVGGPMIGGAQYSLETPIQKATGGVIAFNKEETKEEKQSQCISCSRCADACPVYLEPMTLDKLVKKGKIDQARENNISICLQCGICSYVCPAKINLTETINVGKNEVKRQGSRI